MSVQPLPGASVLPPMKSASQTKSVRPSARRAQGRFECLNTFVDCSMRSVGGTAVKMWFALFRDTKPGGLAHAADTDLARRMGVTTRTVQTARRALVERGLIEVVRRGRLNQNVTCYRVASLTGNPLPVATGKNTPSLRKQASGIPENPEGTLTPGASRARKAPPRKTSIRGNP